LYFTHGVKLNVYEKNFLILRDMTFSEQNFWKSQQLFSLLLHLVFEQEKSLMSVTWRNSFFVLIWAKVWIIWLHFDGGWLGGQVLKLEACGRSPLKRGGKKRQKNLSCLCWKHARDHDPQLVAVLILNYSLPLLLTGDWEIKYSLNSRQELWKVRVFFSSRY